MFSDQMNLSNMMHEPYLQVNKIAYASLIYEKL